MENRHLNCNEYTQPHSDDTTLQLQHGGKHSSLKKSDKRGNTVKKWLSGDTQGTEGKPEQIVTEESVIKSLMTKQSCHKIHRTKRRSRVIQERFADSVSEVTSLIWENGSSRSHESDDL